VAGVPFTPAEVLVVRVRFDSPHVVAYRLWLQRPGQPRELFAEGTDQDTAAVTGHTHQIGPVPSGTKILYLFIFVGNPGTTFSGQLTLEQDGQVIEHGLHTEEGQTDADGVEVRRKEVTL
jgi:hypothetical protein